MVRWGRRSVGFNKCSFGAPELLPPPVCKKYCSRRCTAEAPECRGLANATRAQCVERRRDIRTSTKYWGLCGATQNAPPPAHCQRLKLECLGVSHAGPDICAMKCRTAWWKVEWRHVKNSFFPARSLRTSSCACVAVNASHSCASNGAKIKAFGYRGAKKNELQNYQKTSQRLRCRPSILGRLDVNLMCSHMAMRDW